MADERNNTGKENSGYWNSGNRNSGNRNSGYWNSGDWNSGYWNSGNCNSGGWNSGYCNSGYCNSGDWNSGDWNSGFFNTNKPKIRIFNKETDIEREDIVFPDWFYFDLTKWVSSENMSETEKTEHSEHKITGGYLKVFDYKQAWRNAFEAAELEDLKKTFNLPNFDYALFEEITGISKQDFDNKLGNNNDLQKRIETLEKELNELKAQTKKRMFIIALNAQKK